MAAPAEPKPATVLDEGLEIIIGLVVIVLGIGVAYYILGVLNQTSAIDLGNATKIFNQAMGPIGSGVVLVGVAFLVSVAIVIIQIVRRLRQK